MCCAEANVVAYCLCVTAEAKVKAYCLCVTLC